MRYLGIDYGAKRIGLALSDASGTLATPWRGLIRPADEGGARRLLLLEIERLFAADEGLSGVVIGWPRRLDGSATHQTAHVEALTQELRRQLSVPVVLQDERLSSHEAESRLALRERDWRRRKARLDAAAAAVILQDFLDQRTRMVSRAAEACER